MKRLFKAVILPLSLAMGLTLNPGIAQAYNSQTNLTQEQKHALQENFNEQELAEIQDFLTQSEVQHLSDTLISPDNLQPIYNESTSKLRARPNGCSFSPDRFGRANFKPTCDRHDICYSRSSRTNRIVCDTRFKDQLINECRRAYSNERVRRNACIGVANTYHKAVRTAGHRFYKGQGLNN